MRRGHKLCHRNILRSTISATARPRDSNGMGRFSRVRHLVCYNIVHLCNHHWPVPRRSSQVVNGIELARCANRYGKHANHVRSLALERPKRYEHARIIAVGQRSEHLQPMPVQQSRIHVLVINPAHIINYPFGRVDLKETASLVAGIRIASHDGSKS